jgi:hypothetical protein
VRSSLIVVMSSSSSSSSNPVLAHFMLTNPTVQSIIKALDGPSCASEIIFHVTSRLQGESDVKRLRALQKFLIFNRYNRSLGLEAGYDLHSANINVIQAPSLQETFNSTRATAAKTSKVCGSGDTLNTNNGFGVPVPRAVMNRFSTLKDFCTLFNPGKDSWIVGGGGGGGAVGYKFHRNKGFTNCADNHNLICDIVGGRAKLEYTLDPKNMSKSLVSVASLRTLMHAVGLETASTNLGHIVMANTSINPSNWKHVPHSMLNPITRNGIKETLDVDETLLKIAFENPRNYLKGLDRAVAAQKTAPKRARNRRRGGKLPGPAAPPPPPAAATASVPVLTDRLTHPVIRQGLGIPTGTGCSGPFELVTYDERLIPSRQYEQICNALHGIQVNLHGGPGDNSSIPKPGGNGPTGRVP